jgi:hypothetical protein
MAGRGYITRGEKVSRDALAKARYERPATGNHEVQA